MISILRRGIYDSVIQAFEDAYSWLGKDFASEFLLSVSSYNIQNHSQAPFRIRRHLMLCWKHSWLKSALLDKAYEILGRGLCATMSDISNAALRGTVESNEFVSPYTLKRPFAICTEFGQLSSGGQTNELIQKLLNVLEEGRVEVSLGKIAFLSNDKRQKAIEDYGIYFLDRNTFSYQTNWILMAATYNKRFLVDNALESRFNIMYPKKPLDNKLTKHIVNAGGFRLDEEVKIALRKELSKEKPIETNVKLPDLVYEGKPITPRDCASLLSTILCRSWWNIKTSKDEILQMFEESVRSREEVWRTSEDKVFEAILHQGKTAQEIASELGVTVRQVYYSLGKLRKDGMVNKIIGFRNESEVGVWKVV